MILLRKISDGLWFVQLAARTSTTMAAEDAGRPNGCGPTNPPMLPGQSRTPL